MERYSEHFQADAKARYVTKVTSTGLNIDPYVIPNGSWQNELDWDKIPRVKWSDMFVYLVLTPSPYTREELKVSYE